MTRGSVTGNWPAIIAMAICVLLMPPISSPWAAPSIVLTNVCRYGEVDCHASGTVSGVDSADHYVAVYIQVDEVWWTKPTLVSPQCPIAPDGTFRCDITTGGCDQYATAVRAVVMPKGSDPAPCSPCEPPPHNPDSIASTAAYRLYPRTLAFSGYTWRVKQAPDCPLGPGPNYFSARPRDVWVDEQGLHLRIRNDADRWYASEVILQHALGYGTYMFHTHSRVDMLDPHMVLGLFTWDSKKYRPAHREMDIEFARWGNPHEATNAQFVLQPCAQCPGCRNCSRFQVDLTNQNKYLTLVMIWTPGSVAFRAYTGQYWDTPPERALIHEWTRTGADVPKPGKENVRVNFWLLDGTPPSSGEGEEVILENFIFQPLCSP